MSEFKDKVVVITGGNSGIGEAVVRKFDGLGAKIVIFGRNQEKLDKVCKQLKQAIAIQGDVKKLSDLEHLFKTTQEKFGNIDVLVANAGIAGARSLQDVNEQFFDEMIAINYKGVFFTVHYAVPHLNKGASVILISSIAQEITFPNQSVYSSTKAAVSMLARNFAADLIKNEVRVNAISPGFIDTPIFDSMKNNQPERMEEYAQKVPLKRFGNPAEIADAVHFLSSSHASYIVGIDLVVDGGVSTIYPL